MRLERSCLRRLVSIESYDWDEVGVSAWQIDESAAENRETFHAQRARHVFLDVAEEVQVLT